MEKNISKFTGRLRVRACGICIQNGNVLMIKHENIGKKNFFWSPPGGEVQFGETLERSIIREFKEETNLDIKVGKFICLHEFIDSPLHSLEAFFEVFVTDNSSDMNLGIDPELGKDEQMMSDIRFMPFDEIKKMDPLTVHQIFTNCEKVEDLLKKESFLNFK
ncbi:NUDIX hydrolase [Aureibacter tunicatorum]|uniref:8-oxo-dGTP diphosphatase n=1 Tax=Aureibacter tunicatorum TaxID=866807 RepID=A0AAE4BR73_9BACT|nr:NUDIX hydrolase [Aureibacter tunicatorum]MDR6238361.1 8-oxo-dGTP diphosphatase [Aureibacter tunicatorum]BDD03393.1 hypothetical protein AUTU_08760 [Aureibacter tunicatorum]